MTDMQQREAARQFFYKWNGKGREDEDARSYWIDILQDILGVARVTDRVDFEKKVIGSDGNTKRIDHWMHINMYRRFTSNNWTVYSMMNAFDNIPLPSKSASSPNWKTAATRKVEMM